MTQRRLVVAGLAVAAAGVGLGWALRRPSERAPDGDVVDATHPKDIWSLRFEQPGGGQLALGALRGRPLLLNFWATWCPPCVEEMPLLDRFERAYRAAGWQVVGLAVDSVAPVVEFLAAHPVGFPIGLAGLEGVALSRTFGNPRGSLPFSVAFNRQGDVAERKLGRLTWSELTDWVRRIA